MNSLSGKFVIIIDNNSLRALLFWICSFRYLNPFYPNRLDVAKIRETNVQNEKYRGKWGKMCHGVS